jgi:adenine/guanine phosphoribosyltransferase-like PRPP-binding protein
MIFAVDTGATLLGIAALISALGGVVTTIIAMRKAGSEEHQACLDRLKEVRADAERLAAELHEIKMREADAR